MNPVVGSRTIGFTSASGQLRFLWLLAMISAPPLFHTPTQELFRPHDVCASSACTHDFLIRQLVRRIFLIHQLVRMTFLIRQLVRMNFSIHQLVRMTFLSIRQLVRMTFATHQPVHMNSSNPSTRTHDFSDPSARTHRSCDLSRVMSSTAFTVCALTKYTPPFLISGSCPSPNLKKDFFAKCVSTPCSHSQLTLKIGFVTFTTWKSYPSRLTANSQPDLPLSVLLERFSVGTSETSRTIRLVPVWSSQTTWDTRQQRLRCRSSPVHLHAQRNHLGSSLRH